VDHQKKESSGIKTHEEIIALFKELESMEEKVKNPELLVDELFEPEITLQEIEPPFQIPTEEQQPIEPDNEIPSEKKQKRKLSLFLQHKPKNQIEKKKIKHLSFWRKAKIGDLDPDAITKEHQQLDGVKQPRSTFILQYDENGNLTGFPLKKPKPEKQKKGWFPFRRKHTEEEAEQPEEEPAKGIKGKLKRVVSKIRRKKSNEGESGGGIGGKLKGIFKRKSKE
jgi:hypothetical protein